MAQAPPCGHDPLTADCNLCRHAMKSQKHRDHWGIPGPPPGLPEEPPTGDFCKWSPYKRKRYKCIHFDETPAVRAGPDGKECACQAKWLYGCDLHKRCARLPEAKRIALNYCEINTPEDQREGLAYCCATCPDYEPDVPGAQLAVPNLIPSTRIQKCKSRVPAPESIQAIGPDGLAKGRSGFAFNAGILRYQGRLLLCYRTDWSGAHCHVAELDEELNPIQTTVLNKLYHPFANYGREDPRLFVYRNRLHISYIGVQGVSRNNIRTHQMYARLTDDLKVEKVFYPEYHHRNSWEKNWQFFEHNHDLYCVYSIAPHQILRVKGAHAESAFKTPTLFPWSGGHLRGGAPPVCVGDYYWHWFHGRRDSDRTYNVGVYVFDAKPPFQIRALGSDPLLWADSRRKSGNYCACYFPCGAFLENGKWKITMGWNDRYIRVATWDHDKVCEYLGL